MASTQDNNNSEFDTALVDRAWVQMHEQLEAAMPQSKRRVFAWWWAAFALVGAFLLAVWLWQPAPDAQEEDTGFRKEAVIADATQGSNDPTSTAEPSNDSDAKYQDANRENANRENANSENVNHPDAKHRVSTATVMAMEMGNDQTMEPSNPLTLNDQTPNHSDAQDQEASHQNANHRVATATETETGNDRTIQPSNHLTIQPSNHPTTTPPPFIPTLNHQPSSLNQPPTYSLTNQLSNPKKQPTWNYFLETQAGFSLGDAIQNGLSVGGGIQRSLTSKIKLEVGLQYQWQRSSLLVGNRSDDNNDPETLFDTIFSAQENAYNLTINAATPNLAVNKGNLYIGGHFQVKPRLSLGLGIQASYFTQAYTTVGLAAEPAITQAVAGLNGNILDLYSEDFSVYERDLTTNAVEGPYQLNIRRWQASANTSIRYRFARHWETSLQYQAHLTSWPNKDRTFGGSSTVQLGVRYYLR